MAIIPLLLTQFPMHLLEITQWVVVMVGVVSDNKTGV